MRQYTTFSVINLPNYGLFSSNQLTLYICFQCNGCVIKTIFKKVHQINGQHNENHLELHSKYLINQIKEYAFDNFTLPNTKSISKANLTLQYNSDNIIAIGQKQRRKSFLRRSSNQTKTGPTVSNVLYEGLSTRFFINDDPLL